MANRIKVLPYRNGADPECLLYNDTTGSTIRASQFVPPGVNGTSLWVGTDGHPATCEIRPIPAHNIKLFILHVADAVTALGNFLAAYRDRTKHDIWAVAQPSFASEPLGGHIHLSFYYYEPDTATVVPTGRVLRGAISSSPRRRGAYATEDEIDRYATNPDALDMDRFVERVHSLVGPFERAFFGTHRDARRSIDLARRGDMHEIDTVPQRPGAAYFRIEYRYPSTPLAHPILTYVHHALAKLAVLNYNSLPLGTSQNDEEGEYLVPTRPNELAAVETFLKDRECRYTRELHEVHKAMAWCLSRRWKLPMVIDFDAWAKYKATLQLPY